MDDGVKNVTAYGDTIVVSGVAVMDDATWLEQETITAIWNITGTLE